MTAMRCRLRRDERGAAAVEFALVLIPLLLVVYGIIDFGRAYNAQETLTQAARVGARSAVIGQSTANVKAAVVNAASNTVTVDPNNITVGATCGAGSPAATQITVTATYQFSYLTPLFDKTITLKGTATAPC